LRFVSACGGVGSGGGVRGGSGGGRARNRAPNAAGAAAAAAATGADELLDRAAQRARERAARWVPFVAALTGVAPALGPSGRSAAPLSCGAPPPPAGIAPELETIVAPEPICRALRASGVAARAARRGVQIVAETPELDGGAGPFWRPEPGMGDEPPQQ